MAGTLTLIIGLCGSGKSELIKQLDVDPKLRFDEGFDWNHEGQHEAIVAALQVDKNCAATEVEYCRTEPRETFVAKIRNAVPDANIEYICFENDLAQANRNCVNRKDGRDIRVLLAQNGRLSPQYTFPADARCLPVWRPDGN